ncbi:13393_t:CDS:2, partial [Racocetra persica]
LANDNNLLYIEEKISNSQNGSSVKEVRQQVNSPGPLNFIPLQYNYLLCEKGYLNLPRRFYLIGTITPLILFYKFFSTNSLKQIVESTNKYNTIQIYQ